MLCLFARPRGPGSSPGASSRRPHIDHKNSNDNNNNNNNNNNNDTSNNNNNRNNDTSYAQ